jgi:hypothetical protein
MQRDPTWDVRVGFDRIRWTDDPAAVCSNYPAARRPAEASAPTGLVLEHGTFELPISLDGVIANVSVDFDDHGVAKLDIVSECGDERFDRISPTEWSGIISDRVSAIGKALGVGPVSNQHERQVWSVGDVKIDLLREWRRFQFTLERSRIAGRA